jgi:hypothetical protein
MTYSCVYVPSVEGEYKVMYYLHVVIMSSREDPLWGIIDLYKDSMIDEQ